MNVLDIAQNSIAAAATQIQMEVVERTDAHTLTIGIYDNGCGMTDEQVKSVLDPFYTTRTTRKVGMGVPLFKMAAEQTGGTLTVSSKVGIGTNIKAVFHTDSVDFTPLGDMASTVTTLVSMNTEIQFLYRHKVDKKEFVFDTAEIREILGDVPLSEPAVMQWMREFIEENTKALYGGVTE
ncbi:MAG: ATP-binding protein [Ruminococcus sp.]|nr:ATP-binding protein [Ruminococcus sp.]